MSLRPVVPRPLFQRRPEDLPRAQMRQRFESPRTLTLPSGLWKPPIRLQYRRRLPLQRPHILGAGLARNTLDELVSDQPFAMQQQIAYLESELADQVSLRVQTFLLPCL